MSNAQPAPVRAGRSEKKRADGFVVSKRGKDGHFLARLMNRIKFGSVIRLIDGPLAPMPCVSQTAYSRCTCPDEDDCGLRMLMLDVRTAIIKILDRHTLADIVEITLRKMRRDKVSPPFISRAFNLDSVLTCLPASSATSPKRLNRFAGTGNFRLLPAARASK